MTPDELRPIVDAAGGVEAFAAAMTPRLTPRYVYMLLAGSRKLSRSTALLVRQLEERLKVEGPVA